jgi:hypothetical protein
LLQTTGTVSSRGIVARRIILLFSLRASHRYLISRIKSFLDAGNGKREDNAAHDLEFEVVVPSCNVFQTNDVDCGMFTARNAKEFVLRQQFFTAAYLAENFGTLWRPKYTEEDIVENRKSLGRIIR